MNESGKNATLRPELRGRIVEKAMDLFTRHGIREITMDDIATSLGISKRTLYEVFTDKETLLRACIDKSQQDRDIFVKGVLATSGNVLEVLLKCYQRSIEQLHNTNRRFFEDIKKYPKAYQILMYNRDRDSEKVIDFFKEGVRQGIFRDDINFGIMNMLLKGQFDMLMTTNIFDQYTFLEVYEVIVFTYVRGISTEKGARELDAFITRYREERAQQNNDCA